MGLCLVRNSRKDIGTRWNFVPQLDAFDIAAMAQGMSKHSHKPTRKRRAGGRRAANGLVGMQQGRAGHYRGRGEGSTWLERE